MSLLKTRNAQYASLLYRDYGHVISDEQCKQIRSGVDEKEMAEFILHRGPPFNMREIEFLSELIGDMDDDHSYKKDGHQWTDEVLDKYADHIQNYRYNYTEEALKVDPSIDTEEEHIGPMAQDIEKVNPAAVKTDASGYKVVDTGRLALMNAGAIAELARQVQELKHG